MRRVTEWWAVPTDEHGDSLEVYYCDSRQEARAERERRATDYPHADWKLYRVVRQYHSDGEIADETETEEPW